jgi:alkanesulfonate monooxygenase SsuD/methylene tetrahydromethanopterin reductase-like flavin-dependent oxidoreductase (luciferase family)
MRIGVSYPVTEIAGNPDDIRKFVRAAEELGFSHMMVYDHVVKAPHEGREPKLTGPYTEKDSFHDPFVLFGFAAALSHELEFVTGVLVLPQRQTALVAQQSADVDLLSRERLRLCSEGEAADRRRVTAVCTGPISIAGPGHIQIGG